MSRRVSDGTVFKRCSCRDDSGRLLGSRCPRLRNGTHGRWRWQLTNPGVGARTISGTASSQAEARKALDAARQRIARGIATDPNETTEQALRAWLERTDPKVADRYAERTHRDHVRYVEQHLQPLHHIPWEQLTAADVEQWVRAWTLAGQSLHGLRLAFAALQAAATDDVKRGRLERNVTHAVSLPKMPAASTPDPWTPAELAEFLRAIADDQHRDLIAVTAYCGLRRGEVLALRWSHVAWDRKTLRVPGTKNTDSAATVALADVAWTALARRRREWTRERVAAGPAWDAEADPHVFARPDGRPWNPDYVSRRFNGLVKRTGARAQRFHDLRHAAVTALLAEGVPPVMVGKYVRHGSTRTTTDIYGHLVAGGADVAEAIDRVHTISTPSEGGTDQMAGT